MCHYLHFLTLAQLLNCYTQCENCWFDPKCSRLLVSLDFTSLPHQSHRRWYDFFFLDEGLASIYCVTCMYRGYMSNISCPLGPCIPAVVTCLGCPSPLSTWFTPMHPPPPSNLLLLAPLQPLCNSHVTSHVTGVAARWNLVNEEPGISLGIKPAALTPSVAV